MNLLKLLFRSGAPGDAREDLALKQLLEAASDSRADREPPPFFVSRVRARMREDTAPVRARAGQFARHPIGAAAIQMLPVFLVVVLGVSAWTGYETVEFSKTREAALRRMLETEEGRGDILFAAVMLGSRPEVPIGGGR